MPHIAVRKSGALVGSVKISGAKNAVLPIIAATLLAEEGVSIIRGVPNLRDVHVMCEILEHLGAKTSFEADVLTVDAREITCLETPYELVSKMRASFLVMGSLLGRFKRSKISMPGGCPIGVRPIDLHLKGFRAMGTTVEMEHGYVEAHTSRLFGTKIYLDFPSVGATENIIMAAALAEGVTTIENAAEEPEIVDLANVINEMGGKVRGAGTKTIKVTGVKSLKGTEHTVIPDRIEAGTYMVAAAITKGDVVLENVIIDHLRPVIAKLMEIGCTIEEGEGVLRVVGPKKILPTDIKTMPHPGFPTDLQSPFMALLSLAEGNSVVTETVFENRFMNVSELKRMGANIKIEGKSAVIQGVPEMDGSNVAATDLRAGASLVLSGLVANGETIVSEIYHIERGYVDLVEKLRDLGADIEKIED
ncbi:MAG: UDP-N-acetylglucosamine 1-carboxyvinyltransferase [Peptostreptococcaceae bacterium]|nr:UDP-N-acetylglucosamine 1-carboxyvinyltransferase [Peptostreptococcaceae bacterium]